MGKIRKTQIIPKATAARILFKAGAKRVSQPATDEFASLINEMGMKIGERALEIAKHSGRKTILDGDIKLAASK